MRNISCSTLIAAKSSARDSAGTEGGDSGGTEGVQGVYEVRHSNDWVYEKWDAV